MQTFLICCDELPERQAAARGHLAARRITPVVLSGIHGDTWKLDTTAEYDPGKRISPGHVSLLFNHWWAWKIAQLMKPTWTSTRWEWALFLEDDAVLPENWGGIVDVLLSELAEHNPTWELCMVGLCESPPRVWGKVTERIGPPDSRLCRLANPFGTHAYMVRYSALPKLIAAFPRGGASHNCDQQLWRNVLQPNAVNWCAVLPTLVTQRTFDYTGSGKPEWQPSCIDPNAPPEESIGNPMPESAAQRMAGKDVPMPKPSAELLAATLKTVDPYPCIFKGESQEDHGTATPAAATTTGRRPTIPIFDCARLGVACHIKPSTQVRSVRDAAGNLVRACETCDLRLGMATPAKRERLPLPEGHFNPSIVMYRNRLLLATRDSWGHSRVGLWWLDNERPDWLGEWRVTAIGSYASNHPQAPRLEDPRLFLAEDDHGEWKAHAAFNLPDGYPPKRVRVGYCRFDAELTGIEHTEVFESPAGNAYEKNWSPIVEYRNKGPRGSDDGWSPFVCKTNVSWIYAMKPQHIVKGKQGWTTDNPLPWAGGVMRGGAVPLRVGDEYYVFFHGCLKRPFGNVYTTGCYTFSANPPFQILRQTPVPLVWPDQAGAEDVVKRHVMWPGGAVLHDGAWFVVHGVDDTYCRMIRLEWDVVEKALSSIPEGGTGTSIRDTPLARGVPFE